MLPQDGHSGFAGGGCFRLGARRGEWRRTLNLGIAFWEIFNFKRTVTALQNETSARKSSTNNAAEASTSDHLSDNERHDDLKQL